jgi:glycosyltransferase involved in cell wall biosynthesis
MITYNHEKFVAQAIQSALDQRVNFEYEIVIGEDCSTDETRRIAVDFQRRHPDIIRLLLPERNLGVMKNTVETFRACRGKYVALLEGDDYWTSPHKLQRQVEFLESHPNCSMAFHNTTKVYEDGSREPHDSDPPDRKAISTIDDLWEENFITTCSAMLNRDLIGDLPGWFVDLPWGDWSLFIFAARRRDIGYLSDVMGVHRLHGAGLWSGSNDAWRLEQVIRFYKVMDVGLGSMYHDKIRPLLAEQYFHLALEYERQGNLSNSRKCAVQCFLEDPRCQRIPRRDVYQAIARIHKATLKLHAPSLYRVVAAIRRGPFHRGLSRKIMESNPVSGEDSDKPASH